MSTESAIFTAIPAGRLRDEGLLKVTVFVTPKLTTGMPPGDTRALASYDAFANWPRTLADARWAIDVEGVGTVDARTFADLGRPDAILPDARVWDELFARTVVGDAGFQHFEEAVVHSYPVEEVAKAVTGLYQTIAVSSPTAFPPITIGPLHGQVDELQVRLTEFLRVGRYGTRRRALKARLAQLRDLADPHPDRPGRFLRIDDVPAPERAGFALAAATDFYDRTEDPWDDATATARAPEPVPPEFHSFVARCADYPELLRYLGLAIDLAIGDDDAWGEMPSIRVASGGNADPLEGLRADAGARPFTFAHRTERVWAPGSRQEEPDIRDGSLVIDDEPLFLVEQLDPDGAALKLTTLLADLERTDGELHASAAANNGATSMTPDASSLPALRSTGILVARRDRAAGMVAHFDRSAEHEKARTHGDPARLSAADVTRGWRIDVQDEASGTREWFSLHRRAGVYELVAPDTEPQPLSVQPGPDEGYLKAASLSSGESDPAADQYLHETLAGWDGWSLAVERPGKIVHETRVVDETAPPPDGLPRVADTGFPLATRFRVQKGTLPRLRFGRDYRLRVRAVDLSGRSIPDDQLDEQHERDLGRTYQRWEPVPSPAVIPLTQYTEGESLLRMVIRSTLDVSVDEYIALERVRALPGHEASGDLGIVYRAENERHLAAPIGSVQLAETHGLFDAALSGDPAAVAAQFAIAAREAGSFLTLAGGRVVNPNGPPTALTGRKDQHLETGEYVVHPTRALTLPYLPDPLARGVSFTTLPGDAAGAGDDVVGDPATRMLRWPGDPADWTDRRPVLVRIVEGSGEPAFDADARVLVVPVPKATLRTVKLSSFLDDADVELMRVWHLIAESPTGASPAMFDTVRRGRHWMITPPSELTIVHAVEKPLAPPEVIVEPGFMRGRDETFTLLPGVIRNHAASTGRLDLDAEWLDPIDDVLEPEPRHTQKFAHVSDFLIEPFEDDARMWRSNGPPAGPYGPRHEVRHEFGDTRHRWVRYRATATTRFREYFPRAITDDPDLITSEGEATEVDVPSSARPAPPDVQYLVPFWEWRTEQLDVDSPFAVRRIRTAGGLRVYLARPWFSSGPDELLGVVLARHPVLIPPLEREGGFVLDAATRGASAEWVEQVAERVAARAGEPDAPSAARLEAHVAEAAAAAVRRRIADEASRVVGRVRARNASERFVVAAQWATAAAREHEVLDASRAEVMAGVTAEFLPLFTTTGPEARRYCTTWGADPVFAGDRLPPGPFAGAFPRRTAVGTVRLAEVNDTVTVVGHRPEFDPDRRLWFCDVAIEAGTAYTPFVQLALARYQPHSIAEVELSPVVVADWLQPLPRREATFVATPDRTGMLLTVAGTVGVPRHARALPDLASEIRASRVVEAWVERLPAEAASDLDWVREGEPVVLDVRVSLAALRSERFADAEWVGAVALPEPARGERIRVRLAEYELHEGDSIGLPPLVALLPQRGRRIVYGDSVELP